MRMPVLVLAVLASCAAVPRQEPADPAFAVTARITVDNQGFYDASVYATRDGVTVSKIGTVGGNSRETFVFPRAVLGSQIAMYARTIGEGREFRSGVTQLMPGAWLVWRLGPQPGTEFLYERRSEAQ